MTNVTLRTDFTFRTDCTLRSAVAALAMLLGGSTAVLAQGAPTPKLTTPEFVRAAAQSDEFEAQEGRLAQTASTNPEVRAYGAKMIHDHGMTTAELHAAIQRDGMAVPPPVPLDAQQRAMMGRLEGLTGPAFDAEYAQQAVASHRQALGLHEEYNLHGDDPAIKQASMEATPIIKEHLRIAENMVLGMRQKPMATH